MINCMIYYFDNTSLSYDNDEDDREDDPDTVEIKD